MPDSPDPKTSPIPVQPPPLPVPYPDQGGCREHQIETFRAKLRRRRV